MKVAPFKFILINDVQMRLLQSFECKYLNNDISFFIDIIESLNKDINEGLTNQVNESADLLKYYKFQLKYKEMLLNKHINNFDKLLIDLRNNKLFEQIWFEYVYQCYFYRMVYAFFQKYWYFFNLYNISPEYYSLIYEKSVIIERLSLEQIFLNKYEFKLLSQSSNYIFDDTSILYLYRELKQIPIQAENSFFKEHEMLVYWLGKAQNDSYSIIISYDE